MNAAALTFDAGTHSYTLAGRSVPSVTQVIDEQLHDWSGVPRDVLEAARLFGQHVHDACAFLVRGILDWDSLDAPLVPYVEGARNFLQKSGFVVLASELRLGHPQYRYAGTLDLAGRWKRDLAIVDFKSGAFPKSVGPQTAAYAQAYQHTYGVKVRRRYCVQLNPDFSEGFNVHALTNTADWHYFLSALNCWSFKYAH